MRWTHKELIREFVSVPAFDREWERLKLTDNDYARLQLHLFRNPKEGDVIPGANGCRKMRFAVSDQGKSGGIRVIYLDYVVGERIYFLDVYAKSEKEKPSQEEIKLYSELADKIKKLEGEQKHDERRIQRKHKGS